MDINTVRTGGVLVIKAEGRIDGSNSADFLGSIQAVIDDDDTGVVLDFGGIDYISSAGLRVILLLAKELRGTNTGFGICSLSSAVQEIFSISGFDQIITVSDTEEQAVKSLQ
ncbi:MAG: STAS domain-containing protein [bacterium]|nr:STAS domain-containing protein [bacterium]MCY3580602.1 STAS domain-containing protein [bacterium]MCY3652403.1 STAS domain-containing protein [bacterium]MDE0644150.1 STAS domain-containing protein [bacterium]